MYKIFTRILTNTLESNLGRQPKEQAGFRSGYSTMDYIQVLREITERCMEYEKPLCLAFIDYKKTFDLVYTTSVLGALRSQGIYEANIELIKNIYRNVTSTIRLHKDSDHLNIKRGVRQGDTMSPKLFTALLEEVFKTLDWEKAGISIIGDYLSHLRFADDIIEVACSPDELESGLQELSDASTKVRLKMNFSKTKVMFNQFVQPKEIKVRGKVIETVNKYIYFGQLQSIKENLTGEITRRVKMGWSAFGKLNYIFKGNMPLCLKKKVYDQCFLPVLKYGCETWTLNAKMTQKFQAAQRGMEKCMLAITKRDKKKNTELRNRTKVLDIVARVKQLKWNWAGHIARVVDGRWTKEVLNWYSRDQKRPKKRPNMRWIDEIIKLAGIGWIKVAEDRTLWKILGEAFILQWIDNG